MIKMKKVDICKRCEKEKRIYARNVCYTCYGYIKEHKQFTKYPRLIAKNVVRKCKECGKKKAIRAKGLCQNCYFKKYAIKTPYGAGKIYLSRDTVKDAYKFRKEATEEIYQDIIENPRKWLDQI